MNIPGENSQDAQLAVDVIKINAIGADPEYIYPVADLPHFRTRADLPHFRTRHE